MSIASTASCAEAFASSSRTAARASACLAAATTDVRSAPAAAARASKPSAAPKASSCVIVASPPDLLGFLRELEGRTEVTRFE